MVTLLCSEEEGKKQQMVQTENCCHEDIFLFRNDILCKTGDFFLFKKNTITTIKKGNICYEICIYNVYTFHIIKYVFF